MGRAASAILPAAVAKAVHALTTLASAVHRGLPRHSLDDLKDGAAQRGSRCVFSAQPADTGPLPPRARARRLRRRASSRPCAAAPATTSSTHALTALRNLDHRGATGADPTRGDGAGILTQIPDAFLREVVDFDAARRRARTPSASPSCPTDEAERAEAVGARSRRIAAEEGLHRPRLARRAGRAPTWSAQAARDCMPLFRQLFVAAAVGPRWSGIGLDRLAFCLRKRAEREAGVYFPSLSARTLVYKGMLTTGQLEPFFPDLSDRRFATELALVHSRFSTNTFPSLAAGPPVPADRPQRRDQHRQGQPQLDARPREPARQRRHPRRPRAALPDLHARRRRDSASFDEVLELLHLGGRSLPHAVLMMIPEAWENHAEMDPARRAFYEFHSTFMEPWDGPACVTFTDGTLDRRGARPQRPAPRPLLGHRRRPRRAGLRGRRARPRPGHGRPQGPAAARPDVPRRHRARPDRRRRRDQGRARRRSTRTTSGCTPA